jgi:hypothetical protein
MSKKMISLEGAISKKFHMQYITIELPKFSSNIYLRRNHLSNWLSEYVYIRLNIGLFTYSPQILDELDKELIKNHYKYENIKITIDILEKDTYVFGN